MGVLTWKKKMGIVHCHVRVPEGAEGEQKKQTMELWGSILEMPQASATLSFQSICVIPVFPIIMN
jgi:hypothetical protein